MKARTLAIALLLAASSASPSEAASFTPLASLADGSGLSEPHAVTGDGRVVVGEDRLCEVDSEGLLHCHSAGPVVWHDGEVSSIQSFGNARDVSASGAVVVGYSVSFEDDGRVLYPTVWQEAVGWREVAPTSDLVRYHGLGVSADGEVVVGERLEWTDEGGFVHNPFRADAQDGALVLPDRGRAVDVSADGLLVVGSITVGEPPHSRARLFRWKKGSDPELLSPDTGQFRTSIPAAISDDGSTVVGYTGELGHPIEAFRWTGAAGFQGLGFLGYYPATIARGVSADGSVIVGKSGLNFESLEGVAFLWSERDGMRALEDILIEQGVELGGWELTSAADVSDDGSTVVGVGFNPQGEPQGWIATVPEPRADVSALAALLALAILGSRKRGRFGARVVAQPATALRVAVVLAVFVTSASHVSAQTMEVPRVFREARILPAYESGRMIGLRLSELPPGGLYDRMGFEPGDTILSVNDRPIDGPSAAAAVLRIMSTASSLRVLVKSAAGPTRIVEIRTASEPGTAPGSREQEQEPGATHEPAFLPYHEEGRLAGAVASRTDPSLPGLRRGDVILEVDGRPVDSLEAVAELNDRFLHAARVELLFRDESGAQALSSITTQ